MLATADQDYCISLSQIPSGEAYTLFKDNNLLYNPVTQTLKINSIKFPGYDQTSNGLPKSSQTYLDQPATQALAALSLADIAGLQATIKPSSIEAKILVVVRWIGELGVATDTWNSMFGLKRNGSPIGNAADPGARPYGMASNSGSYNHGTDANSTPELVQYYYIDSPGTTEPVTYQATILVESAQTLYTNRTVGDNDTAASYERTTSNIFLMEVL